LNHFKNYGRYECRPFKYKNVEYNKNMCINYNDILYNYDNNYYDLTGKHLGLPLYWNNIIRRNNLPFLYVENYNNLQLEKMLIMLLCKILLRSCNIYNLNNIVNNDNIININAWNEWNEQAVLEPNNITGYETLETIFNIIKNT
jgi:hypothetical protein